MLSVFLILATAWVVFMVSSSLYKGFSENWLTLVFSLVIWVAFGPFLLFQIRYGLRVKRLLKDAHHKSFKRQKAFSKHEPVKQVNSGVRSILKKEKIFFKPGHTKFRIPEVGRFKHNLYLQKLGIRIIIKKHTALQSGDGSILLIPENTTQEKMDRLKDLIEEAFE